VEDLTCGLEVWQTLTEEANKLLATEIDSLRISAGRYKLDIVWNIKMRKIIADRPNIMGEEIQVC
jgi:hypothetical protein